MATMAVRMSNGDETTGRSRPVLLVGSGNRPKELGAVLSALGTVRARRSGEAVLEPHRPMGLADLEELLAQRPAAGTLILDYERVPGEDIGFVRRFLERHGEWRLIVVGEDVRDRRARGLLALPRTQCLPWPPDLEQIAALLPPIDEEASADRQPTAPASAPSESPGSNRETRHPDRARKKPRSTGASTPGVVRAEKDRTEPETGSGAPLEAEPMDIGALIEELLAGASLVGESTPRYLYRCASSFIIYRERAPLAEILGELLELARRCAGGKGVVSAQVDNAPEAGDPADTARIRVDFPAGPLSATDWPVLFDTPIKVAADLADVVKRAGRAAADLRSIGGRIAPFTLPQDRLRLELFIASEPLAQSSSAAASPARRSKAEDPFA